MRGHFVQKAAQKWFLRLHSMCDFGESGSFKISRPKCLFFATKPSTGGTVMGLVWFPDVPKKLRQQDMQPGSPAKLMPSICFQ